MSQSIFDIMGQIRGGYALFQATKKLMEIVAAVRAAQADGKLIIEIVVKPDKTDERIIHFHPAIKAKIPEKKFSPGIFFVAPDGSLSKEDPAQLELQMEREKQGVASLAKIGTGTAG